MSKQGDFKTPLSFTELEKGSTSSFLSCVPGYKFTVWYTVTIVITLFLVAAGSYYKNPLYITCTLQIRGQEGRASEEMGGWGGLSSQSSFSN